MRTGTSGTASLLTFCMESSKHDDTVARRREQPSRTETQEIPRSMNDSTASNQCRPLARSKTEGLDVDRTRIRGPSHTLHTRSKAARLAWIMD